MHICGNPWHGAAWAAATLGLVLGGCTDMTREPPTERVTPRAVQRAAAARSAAATAAADEAEAPALPPAPPPALTPTADGEVRLMLLDAVRHALAHNHEIQIAGYGPPIAREDIVQAEAVFDPSVFLSNTFNRVDRPTQTTIDTGVVTDDELVENRWSSQYGLQDRMLGGGTVALYQDMSYLRSNSRLTLPNPQYVSGLTTELNQPLLKGLGDPVNRAAIRVANLNHDVSHQAFRQKVMEVVAETVTTYWQLAFDLEEVRVSQNTLDLAREVLRREKERLGGGLSTNLSVNRAQAAVATREAALVRARIEARNTMDQLKLLLNAPDLPLDGNLRLVPGEAPQFYILDVDRNAAVAKAMIYRPDLENARTAIAINQARLHAADRERLPKLDAVLKYTLNGLDRRLGSALDMQDPGGPFSWTAGFQFEMPLGNRAAESDHRKRLLEYEQSLVEADRQVAIAIRDVNLAVRRILSARDEVEATLRAKTAADETVRGEFVRFELGQVTNEELLRAQENLGAAERDHLQALLTFNLSLIDLSKAQGTLLEDQGIEVVPPRGPRSEVRPVQVRFHEAADAGPTAATSEEQ